jgi:GAF domain-containing protein
VLGVVALFESLIERVALGPRASLVFELAVPLGLGVSLSTVHRRIDTLVDRLIFRRQYREETALRRFATESAFVTHEDTLLDLAVDQILLHVGAPWVAIFEYGPRGYRRVRQRGTHDLPAEVAVDDLTVVKLRAHGSDIDLHDTQSGLGREGYAFPLRLRDHLLGVLVVGPRPGEHYAADERELIGHVAQSVGASLFALRARASDDRLQIAEEHLRSARSQLEEAAARLEQAHALRQASETRESALLDALRALGADPRVSANVTIVE